MHRNDDSVGQAGHTLQRLMIGAVEAFQPALALACVETHIAGDQMPISDLHNECGIVEPAIGIDQEA